MLADLYCTTRLPQRHRETQTQKAPCIGKHGTIPLCFLRGLLKVVVCGASLKNYAVKLFLISLLLYYTPFLLSLFSQFRFTETDRFKKMLVADIAAAGKVGNGTGDFQNPAVGARTEFITVDRIAEQRFAGG